MEAVNLPSNNQRNTSLMRESEASELKIWAFHTCFSRFSQILNFPEFPGFFSFPRNYLERIKISQNSGNFLQSGNTGFQFHDPQLKIFFPKIESNVSWNSMTYPGILKFAIRVFWAGYTERTKHALTSIRTYNVCYTQTNKQTHTHTIHLHTL